jgi:hypothetical protein
VNIDLGQSQVAAGVSRGNAKGLAQIRTRLGRVATGPVQLRSREQAQREHVLPPGSPQTVNRASQRVRGMGQVGRAHPDSLPQEGAAQGQVVQGDVQGQAGFVRPFQRLPGSGQYLLVSPLVQ